MTANTIDQPGSVCPCCGGSGRLPDRVDQLRRRCKALGIRIAWDDCVPEAGLCKLLGLHRDTQRRRLEFGAASIQPKRREGGRRMYSIKEIAEFADIAENT